MKHTDRIMCVGVKESKYYQNSWKRGFDITCMQCDFNVDINLAVKHQCETCVSFLIQVSWFDKRGVWGQL